MTASPRQLAAPANVRELRLMSAGQFSGMRNYAMALARGAKGHMRASYAKSARNFHRTYLERLKEAQDATFGRPVGYYVPGAEPSKASHSLPAATPGYLMRRQAGGR